METSNVSVTFVGLFFFPAIYKYIYKISKIHEARKPRAGNMGVARASFTEPEPDLALSWGAGFVLLALPAFLPSVVSSFLPKVRVGPGPPGPLP